MMILYKHFSDPPILKPKYSFEIWQYDSSGQPCLIFDDLAAEPFLRWSIYAQRLLANNWLNYHQISPAKWRIGIVWDYNLSFPNALKYVLCAINRSHYSEKIAIQAPKDFTFLVQVHEAALRLDVDAIKATTFTAILTALRERLLFPAELVMLYCCISPHDFNLYTHALNLTSKKLRQHRTGVSSVPYLQSLLDTRITGVYSQRVARDLMAVVDRNAQISTRENNARHGREAQSKLLREFLPVVSEHMKGSSTTSGNDTDDEQSGCSSIEIEDSEQRPITPLSDHSPWDSQRCTYSPGTVCSEAWTI